MFPAGLPDYRVSRVSLTDGLAVRVTSCGTESDSPVLFLPGWGCSSYSFRRNLLPVARGSFSVHCPDLRGHGLSDKPADAESYSTAAMIEHVLDIADALGLSRFALVGHSMGAALAARVAAHSPERITSLAMISPVGLNGLPMLGLAKVLTPRPSRTVLPRVASRSMVRFFLWLAYGDLGDFGRREVDEYWAPSQFPEFTWALRHLLHEFDWGPLSPAALAAISAPSLVAFGSRDHLIRRDATAWFREAIPGIEVREFPDAGHVAPEEIPELVNEWLIAILRRGQ